MKNLKSLLSLAIVILSFQLVTGQELAYMEKPSEANKNMRSVKEVVSIDQTGIVELSNYIVHHIDFPYEALGYKNMLTVKVQISLNKKGEIIAVHLVDNPQKSVGDAILKSLSTIEKVSPILINGVPKAQTIQLPLVFTQ